MPWTDRIGRRVKLQDIHVLLTVVQAGSMGKAALKLATSQSAVSRAVSDLEHALKVKLLERSPVGVEPTKYGRALVECGTTVFDDLRQGMKTIDFLADPSVGEIKIGGNEAVIAGLLPTIYGRLRRRYPGINIHAVQAGTDAQQHAALREKTVDLIVGRADHPPNEAVKLEMLFRERVHIVAGARNPLTRRRKIELAELVNEPWTLPPPETQVGRSFVEAFEACGLEYPKRGVAFGHIHLHRALVENGPFLAFLPDSILRFGSDRQAIKVLPVKCPVQPLPVSIMTLRGRIETPAVQLFIEAAREVARPLANLQQ